MRIKKINYSVIIDGTVVGTRKSHRDYTHAVASVERGAWAYCGRLDLAEKMLRNHGASYDVIVPVTIDNPNL